MDRGIKLDCENENKFYFEIDSEFDSGGTLDLTVFNSTTEMCLTQTRPENDICPIHDLKHNQENVRIFF